MTNIEAAQYKMSLAGDNFYLLVDDLELATKAIDRFVWGEKSLCGCNADIGRFAISASDAQLIAFLDYAKAIIEFRTFV